MNRSLLWRFLLIVFIVAACITFAWPPKNRPLIEVFKEKLQKPDQNMEAVLKKFDELQKANPQSEFKNLKEAVGTNDLTKYFNYDFKNSRDAAALKDPNSTILNWLQRSAAGKIRLGLDLQGGSSFLVRMQTGKLATNTTSSIALNNAVEVLRKRVDRFGVAEPLIQPVGEDRIQVQMPGLSEADLESVRGAIQKAAFLEFRWVHDESPTLLGQNIVPPGFQRMREVREDENGKTTITEYIVNKTAIPGLNGKNVKTAHMSRDNLGRPEIDFTLDTEGAAAFAKVTENRGKLMAIILDGELYSAPRINDPITTGSGRITGSFTEKEAQELAAVLQNPLEAPLEVLSEERVDPSLGKDTIRSGIQSAIYATIAVAAFMGIYYLFAGMVANVALITNIIVLLGVMCSIKTTLTLPGIAGIVLTVGMAVDANVLIFERIREETAKGKSLRGALAAGYSRAFGTIFDSHVTTLISSIILWVMGTGTIKGFGVALTIGVAASLFTALVVTRLVFDFMLDRGMLKSMPMLHIIKSSNLDFMKFAKPAFAISWLIIIVGVGYGLHRGFNKHDILGIDFVGGDNMTLAFKQKIDVDQVRKAITPVVQGESLIQYQRAIAGTDEKLRITVNIPKSGTAEEVANKVVSTLKTQFPQAGFELKGSERVGATVGEEILRSAVVATLLSLLGILVYVAFRYEFSFAVAAVIAIVHDFLMTLGIYSLTGVWGHGRELNATMVAAMLTIIGFSINDTIVIFDRIREDLKMGVRGTFRELINQALNQTLSRTIITSGTVFIATMALYLFGGGAINDFAFTFLAGIITGTYSSIYIASALVLWWHKGQRPTTGSHVVMEAERATVKA